MKSFRYLLAFAMTSVAVAAFATPQADSVKAKSSQSSPATTAQAGKTVGQALQGAKYVFAEKKAKPNAKYYIFLYSASWCAPCRHEMPKIAKLYTDKISKDPRVELVHFSNDQDANAAKRWAQQTHATFPIIANNNKAKIPGDVKPRGIPHMRIVDSTGKLIKEGHGAEVMNYSKYIPKQ